MQNKTITSPPNNYPVCQHHDCPMAATCLHHIAYVILLQSEDHLNLINPNRCSKDAACSFYRDSSPVRYARGFTGFQKCMFPQQYDKFMTNLCLHFGRNQYFKRRRGDVLLPPEEQDMIKLMLRNVGADSSMDFDQYEEKIIWIP